MNSWIQKQGVYYCKYCGKKNPYKVNSNGMIRCWASKYCPHCGKKMK